MVEHVFLIYKYIRGSSMILIEEDDDVKILQVQRKIGVPSIFPLKRLIVGNFEVITESCSRARGEKESTMFLLFLDAKNAD